MNKKQITSAIKKYQAEADSEFKKLAKFGREARRRGYFTKEEFLKVCRWKSSMRMDLCRLNSAASVIACTKAALAATDSKQQITVLLRLDGVAVPRASALLAVSNPKAFGVIDVRAWQCLHSAGLVDSNSAGKNLSPTNWATYVEVLKKLAEENATTPRLVELALYKCHKAKYTTQGIAINKQSESCTNC